MLLTGTWEKVNESLMKDIHILRGPCKPRTESCKQLFFLWWAVYECKSCILKKQERKSTHDFELWCCRRWHEQSKNKTNRLSNKSIQSCHSRFDDQVQNHI